MEKEFISKLNRLQDFPERTIILDLTRFAEVHVMEAGHLASLIVTRLNELGLPPGFKLPMFYLIDSIMKNVGGPYAAFFGRFLGETFLQCFQEVPDRDREKLDFLLKTWRERNILSLALLNDMTKFNMSRMGRGAAAVVKPAPIVQSQLQQQQQQQLRALQQQLSRPPPAASTIVPARARTPPQDYIEPIVNSNNKRNWQDSNDIPSSRASYKQQPSTRQSQQPSQLQQQPPATGRITQQEFDSMVAIEIENLLNELYDGMPVEDRIPYAQLAVVNPSLCEQIRHTAVVNVDDRLKNILPVRQQQQGMGLRSGSGGVSPAATRGAVVVTDRLPGDPEPSVAAGGIRNAPRDARDGRDGPDRGMRGSGREEQWRASSTSINASSTNVSARSSAGVGPRGGGGMSGGRSGASGQQFQQPVYTTPTGVSAGPGTSYVRAFINESPVIVDMVRTKELLNSLLGMTHHLRRKYASVVETKPSLLTHSDGASNTIIKNPAIKQEGVFESKADEDSKDSEMNVDVAETTAATSGNASSDAMDVVANENANELVSDDVIPAEFKTIVDNAIAESKLVNQVDSFLQEVDATLGAASKLSSNSGGTGVPEVKIQLNSEEEKRMVQFLLVAEAVTQRLEDLVATVHVPPPLPTILQGLLPLEPSKEYQQKLKLAAELNRPKAKPVQKLPIPPFRVDELHANPDKALYALYFSRPHQYSEDGLRFATLSDLAKHTDEYLISKDKLKKREASGEKVCRLWYVSSNVWCGGGSSGGGVGGSGAAGIGGSANAATSGGASSAAGGLSGSAGAGSGEEETFVVPADENFTRCPISREVFETVWDEDEGLFMYRNAVKVLVTPAADHVLYQLAQPTGQTDIRYIIVHKLLVLDGWCQLGKADTLTNTKLRYQQIISGLQNALSNGSSGADSLEVTKTKMDALVSKVEGLVKAATEADEDEDDVFVMLESSN